MDKPQKQQKKRKQKNAICRENKLRQRETIEEPERGWAKIMLIE